MSYRQPFRQTRLTPIGRRFRFLLSRLFGVRLQKSQQIAFVDINGQRFKRIILRDSYLASRIEQALEAFGASENVPGLVIRYEHEVWVDFVAGEVPTKPSHELAREVAQFYAQVYHRSAGETPSAGSIWLARIRSDLQFLARVGVLSNAAAADIESAVERLTPAKFWLGFDYNDPVVKNFVRTDAGILCGIDVESLVEDQLIGLGVAKALARWMEPYRATFFDAYNATGAPDFQHYLGFIEIAYLAAYTKLMFVERKWTNVEPTRFDRFR